MNPIDFLKKTNTVLVFVLLVATLAACESVPTSTLKSFRAVHASCEIRRERLYVDAPRSSFCPMLQRRDSKLSFTV